MININFDNSSSWRSKKTETPLITWNSFRNELIIWKQIKLIAGNVHRTPPSTSTKTTTKATKTTKTAKSRFKHAHWLMAYKQAPGRYVFFPICLQCLRIIMEKPLRDSCLCAHTHPSSQPNPLKLLPSFQFGNKFDNEWNDHLLIYLYCCCYFYCNGFRSYVSNLFSQCSLGRTLTFDCGKWCELEWFRTNNSQP